MSIAPMKLLTKPPPSSPMVVNRACMVRDQTTICKEDASNVHAKVEERIDNKQGDSEHREVPATEKDEFGCKLGCVEDVPTNSGHCVSCAPTLSDQLVLAHSL